MDPIIERFTGVAPALRQAIHFDEVLSVCRVIDALNSHLDVFEKHARNETYFQLNPPAEKVTLLLIQHFFSTKDLKLHMAIMKAIMKPALCMNYYNVEQMLMKYELEISRVGAECLRIYGWLQNKEFTSKFGVNLPNNLKIEAMFTISSLKYSDGDSKYFALAIENLIQAYDLSIISGFNQFTFDIISTNLENYHRDVQKLLLELFKRLVKCCRNNEGDLMVKDILLLPWTNRNKYYLLSNILTTNSKILLQHEKFDLKMFLEGITVGLTMFHLLAPSQCLIRAVYKTKPFTDELQKVISRILWNGDDQQQADNLLKFWFTTFDQQFATKLFEIMSKDGKFRNFSSIPSSSSKFHRLLMLRNAFKKCFKDSKLDQKIMKIACSVDDLQLKIEIFYIMLNTIYTEPENINLLTAIMTLLNFLQYNMCLEDSNLVDHHVMKKLPEFFNFLASRKMRDLHIQKEIFSIIKNDIYQHGIDLGRYESLTFSLKLLRIILKQYFGTSGDRLHKNTNLEGNLNFGKYLKEHKIWDITSEEIFMHLIELMEDNDNSDISEMSLNMLVEYFIKPSKVDYKVKCGDDFFSWIAKKVDETFNATEISYAYEAKRYFILSFEYLMAKGCCFENIFLTVDLLKSRLMELRTCDDPVLVMERGLNLFNVIDCINYAISRIDPAEARMKFISVLIVLIKIIAYRYLDYANDPATVTNFDILDQRLCELVKKSQWQESDVTELKPKLMLIIWYTFRSISETLETLTEIVNKTLNASDKEHQHVFATCIDINIQILSRFCHKGAIESASKTIGRVTKIVSTEFLKLCSRKSVGAQHLQGFLVTLKKEIDCTKGSSSETGEIRCSRGLILMAHQIISNHPPFLKFLMENLMMTRRILSFKDLETIKYKNTVKPLQLHLLAALIKDSVLVEDMLKYYDFILLATFGAYKECKNFVMENALLQVIGSIVPKISNQKRHLMNAVDSDFLHYEPKAVTFYEMYVRMPASFRIALFDLKSQLNTLSVTYIIVLLEFLSSFEYRNTLEYSSEMHLLRKVFESLLYHDCEKIRTLAGRCFSQWQNIDEDLDDSMLNTIKMKIGGIFSANSNKVDSTARFVRHMIERYESSVKHVKSFDWNELLGSLQNEVLKDFPGNFSGAINFYVRIHLLDFLLFLGFDINSKLINSLMLEKGLSNDFGYKLWNQKIRKLRK